MAQTTDLQLQSRELTPDLDLTHCLHNTWQNLQKQTHGAYAVKSWGRHMSRHAGRKGKIHNSTVSCRQYSQQPASAKLWGSNIGLVGTHSLASHQMSESHHTYQVYQSHDIAQMSVEQQHVLALTSKGGWLLGVVCSCLSTVTTLSSILHGQLCKHDKIFRAHAWLSTFNCRCR